MKAFTLIAPFLTLFTPLTAEWIGNYVDIKMANSVSSPPVPLNENTPIEVKLRDLHDHPYFFYIVKNGNPLETFTFVFSTSSSSIPKDKQEIVFDVSGIRSVAPGITLSVRGCDNSAENCYPATTDKSGPKLFEKDSLKLSNTTSLSLSKFSTQGDFVYVYLQIEETPGKDNPDIVQGKPGQPSQPLKYSDDYHKVTQYESDVPALAFSLQSK